MLFPSSSLTVVQAGSKAQRAVAIPIAVSANDPNKCTPAEAQAQANCPRSSKVTTSAENVEKVVSPPRNPVTQSSRHSGGRPDLMLKVAVATPTRKPPSRMAANVPSGTVGNTGFSISPSHQRKIGRAHV